MTELEIGYPCGPKAAQLDQCASRIDVGDGLPSGPSLLRLKRSTRRQASSGSGPSESEGALAARVARRWKAGIGNVFHK